MKEQVLEEKNCSGRKAHVGHADDLRHVTVGSAARQQIVDVRGGDDRQKQSPG